MYHNINAGRLRHYVELYLPSNDTDAYGQVADKTLVFDARANVKTASGAKVQDYGTAMTSTIITVLMWFDDRIADKQVLVWEGVEYEVNHVNPDDYFKAMILTCEVIKK